VSVFKRPESNRYVVEVRWRGVPRLKLSTGSTSKARAGAMERTLQALRDIGRFDVLRLLGEGKLRLADVHEDYQRDPAALQQRVATVASPVLGPLVDEWLKWLESPAALSLKTRRPFSPRTAYRYRESWQRLFRILPRGRVATLADITKGFVADFREARRREGKAGSTINRDLCALSAFRRWCAEEQDLAMLPLKMAREREPAGRERWLSAEELKDLEFAMPREWWPLFATLAFTGLRIGEAQGLRLADVRLAERRITVSDRLRQLKNASSVRDVPIPEPLARVLAEHVTRFPIGPNELLFDSPLNDYRTARRVFSRASRVAGLRNLTLHDLRHTFAVHAAQSGVPIPRIQKLLGHATVAMAMRYMKHAPEAYFAEDAAKVAMSLTALKSKEDSARADLARETLRLG
jgi:integrase